MSAIRDRAPLLDRPRIKGANSRSSRREPNCSSGALRSSGDFARAVASAAGELRLSAPLKKSAQVEGAGESLRTPSARRFDYLVELRHRSDDTPS